MTYHLTVHSDRKVAARAEMDLVPGSSHNLEPDQIQSQRVTTSFRITTELEILCAFDFHFLRFRDCGRPMFSIILGRSIALPVFILPSETYRQHPTILPTWDIGLHLGHLGHRGVPA